MRGKKHSNETTAAVMAALLAGQSVSEVARTYKLSTSTICNIKRGMNSSVLEQVGAKKQDEIGELLTSYLRELLTTIKVQATFMRDTQWLKGQEAAQVATLFGVANDKAFRLLEAAELSEPTGPGNQG